MTEYRTIAVEDATGPELRAFASILNLDIDNRVTDPDKLRAKLAEAGFTASSFRLPLHEAVAPVQSGVPTRIGREGVYYGVLIHVQDKEYGDREVELGCNGEMRLYPRGRAVWMPARFFESLMNAVQQIYDRNENGKIIGKREVASVPFSHGLPAGDEGYHPGQPADEDAAA